MGQAENVEAKPEKIASVTGEVKTKLPTWSDEQKNEAAGLRAEAMRLNGEKRFSELWTKMRYDDPSSFIDAAALLIRELQDIADQANQGVQS